MNYSQTDLAKAVQAVFNSYDTDKNGTLEAEQVTNLINDALKQMQQSRKVSTQEVNQFISSVDTNNDRKISKEQLLLIFKKVITPKH